MKKLFYLSFIFFTISLYSNESREDDIRESENKSLDDSQWIEEETSLQEKSFSNSSPADCNSYNEILLEVKGAYYYPLDSLFRDIYSGNGIYALEASFQAWNRLYPWASVSYFTASGHSINGNDSTKIFFVPIGVGLKWFFKAGFADFYFGAGILGTYLHITDDSPFVYHVVRRWGIGGIAKGGVLFDLSSSFFLDLFTEYSYMKIHVHGTRQNTLIRQPANLSGMSFGAGIGYRF